VEECNVAALADGKREANDPVVLGRACRLVWMVWCIYCYDLLVVTCSATTMYSLGGSRDLAAFCVLSHDDEASASLNCSRMYMYILYICFL